MSLVAEVPEGAEMVRQLLKYDGIIVTRAEFGRLSFSLDVNNCPLMVAQNIIDALEHIDSLLGGVYVSGAGTIDFDYYVTGDLLAPIRRVVDTYQRQGAKLLSWSYRGR